MKELSLEAYKIIKPIFDSIIINRQAVALVIGGNYPGRIFVDQGEKPTAALIYTGSFVYLGGNANNASFNEQMKNLLANDFLPRAEGGPLFIFSATDEWQSTLDELLCAYQVNKFKRLKYELSLERFKEHRDWQTKIPKGFEVRQIDHSSTGYLPDYALEYWGNGDQFLREGFGYVIVKNNQLVSVCWTMLLGNHIAELAVETDKNYRRQGFATFASCACIDHCLENHLGIEWDCFELPPSMNLAEKLGFVKKFEVDVHILA